MDLDTYSENNEDSIKIENEESTNDAVEAKTFTVDEALNDFVAYPIAYKIQHICSMYNFNDFERVKNAVFQDVSTKEEFVAKLPVLLSVVSSEISKIPNGIVLNGTGDILKAQSLAQAREKGIRNEYIESYIMQENRRNQITQMFTKIVDERFKIYNNATTEAFINSVVETTLKNDTSFFNTKSENYDDIVKFCKQLISIQMQAEVVKTVEDTLIEKSTSEKFDIKDYKAETEEDRSKTKRALEEALDDYSCFWRDYDSGKNDAREVAALRYFSHIRQLLNVLEKGNYREMPHDDVIRKAYEAIDWNKKILDVPKALDERKGKYVASVMEKENVTTDYMIYIFLEEAKSTVPELTRMALESKQKEMIKNNAFLKTFLEKYGEQRENGTFKLPDAIKSETKDRVVTQYAAINFHERLANFEENPNMCKGKEHAYTKYLIGVYEIFKNDKFNCIDQNEDIKEILVFLDRLNPDIRKELTKGGKTFTEKEFVDAMAKKCLETDKRSTTPGNIKTYIYEQSTNISNNFAQNIANQVIASKDKINESTLEEFLKNSKDVILVDNSIEYLNTSSKGQLNSYKTRVTFTQNDHELYDRVKKATTVDTWVDNSNIDRTTYLTTMMTIAHLKDTGRTAEIEKYEKFLKEIEAKNPEAVKDCVGRSFEGMTDKKFSDVNNSKQFKGREEDAKLYEEALKFSCKKVEARVFQYFEEKIFPANSKAKFKFVSPQEKAEAIRYALLCKELANQTGKNNINLQRLYNKMYMRALDVVSDGKKEEFVEEYDTKQGRKNPRVKTEVLEKAIHEGKNTSKMIFGSYGDDSKSLFEGYKFEYMQDKMEKFYQRSSMQDIPIEKKSYGPISKLTECKREEALEYYEQFYGEIRKYVKLNNEREVSNMDVTLKNRMLGKIIHNIQGTKVYKRGMQAIRAYKDYDRKTATKMCFNYLMRKGRDTKKAIGRFMAGSKLDALPGGEFEGLVLEEVEMNSKNERRENQNQVDPFVCNKDASQRYDGALIVNQSSKKQQERKTEGSKEMDEGEER